MTTTSTSTSSSTSGLPLPRTPKLDAFTRSYLDAALWSSTHPDTDEPLDATHTVEDFTPAALTEAIRDCERFQALAGDMLHERDDSRAGHDFWLTRNGHGAGFWDGDWPVNGDALTELCKRFREVSPWPDIDGALNFEVG